MACHASCFLGSTSSLLRDVCRISDWKGNFEFKRKTNLLWRNDVSQPKVLNKFLLWELFAYVAVSKCDFFIFLQKNRSQFSTQKFVLINKQASVWVSRWLTQSERISNITDSWERQLYLWGWWSFNFLTSVFGSGANIGLKCATSRGNITYLWATPPHSIFMLDPLLVKKALIET